MRAAQRYKVTDIQTGEVVLTGVKISEVADFFGMNPSNVARYAENGYRIKRQYIIEKDEYDEFFERYGIRAVDYDQAMKEFREKMKGVPKR